jgi:hypothetical protein
VEEGGRLIDKISVDGGKADTVKRREMSAKAMKD